MLRLGRRHQSEVVMDIRRTLLHVPTQWYPNIRQLHRFMTAVSRVTVNHDGRGVGPRGSGQAAQG